MYKYVKKKYADQLFNQNRIRIGTLNWYRDMEEDKKGIADPLEGSYRDELKVKSFTEKDYLNNRTVRQNIPNFLGIDKSWSNVTIKNFSIIDYKQASNFLIFCSAHKKSQELFNEFEGADTCYEIHNHKKFFQLITRELKKQIKSRITFINAFYIDYGDYHRTRNNIYEDALHPVLVKTRKFERQCEVRAVWEVEDPSILEPFYDLQVPHLRTCCRLINP